MKNTIELTDEELDIVIFALFLASAQMRIVNREHISKDFREVRKAIQHQTAS